MHHGMFWYFVSPQETVLAMKGSIAFVSQTKYFLSSSESDSISHILLLHAYSMWSCWTWVQCREAHHLNSWTPWEKKAVDTFLVMDRLEKPYVSINLNCVVAYYCVLSSSSSSSYLLFIILSFSHLVRHLTLLTWPLTTSVKKNIRDRFSYCHFSLFYFPQGLTLPTPSPTWWMTTFFV